MLYRSGSALYFIAIKISIFYLMSFIYNNLIVLKNSCVLQFGAPYAPKNKEKKKQPKTIYSLCTLWIVKYGLCLKLTAIVIVPVNN